MTIAWNPWSYAAEPLVVVVRPPPSARGSRRARRAPRRSDASPRPAPSRARAPGGRRSGRRAATGRVSYSSAIRSTTGSRRFQASRGWTVVPRPCSTRTRPRSSSSFRPSRMTVRLKPNCSQSAGSVGRTSSSANAPLMICRASSSTTTAAKRAGRHGAPRSRDRMRLHAGRAKELGHANIICPYVSEPCVASGRRAGARPATSRSTSASVAIEVSPGVVIASAPCATP